ncbi:MAG TPA: LysE family transporter [Geminicoccaceae bacterium]
MDLDLYLAFLLATTVLILIPGPNVTLLVANSLTHGPRRALITLAGTSSAIALQLAVVAFGMGSLILVLAQWFEWLRWAGVAYLMYLGVQQWRAAPLALDDLNGPAIRSGALFWQGVLVSATNPKTLLFYAAFFPQFIDPASPPGPQLALLSITFLVVATMLDAIYAILAGRLRPWLRTRRRARLRNRLTGSFLIAAALGLALARRGS